MLLKVKNIHFYMNPPLIQFQNITKIFSKKVVLDNVNLDIPYGEIFGIIGKSGSGKTTLLSILVGFIKPEKGRIYYQSQNLDKFTNNIRQQFGFTAQEGSFYPNLTVRENLEYFGTMYNLPLTSLKNKIPEKLFEVLSLPQKVQLSEKVSGDSSFSHSLAFCQAVESLNDIPIPKRARLLRVVFAELERIANHIGDIGFIMLDTGFNFGGANGSRLKEMVMQINEYLTDSRFLRGVNAIGGAAKDISKEQQRETLKRLETIIKDFSAVVDIARDNASLLNRLEGTGILTAQVAAAHGVVGVAGKALGIEKDARVDYPYAAYDELQLNEIAKEQKGDVYARFNVRIKEVYASYELIKNALEHLPEGELCARSKTLSLKKNALGISIVEGWRGDIVYFITTDSEGNISRVAPRDPSFVNWIAVGLAGPGNIVPDFPLINKSFNLSYSGNDL